MQTKGGSPVDQKVGCFSIKIEPHVKLGKTENGDGPAGPAPITAVISLDVQDADFVDILTGKLGSNRRTRSRTKKLRLMSLET
jgi:hypothetical protein